MENIDIKQSKPLFAFLTPTTRIPIELMFIPAFWAQNIALIFEHQKQVAEEDLIKTEQKDIIHG